MEIYELKYFLAVARVESVNKAVEEIHISAGSLSKAIARLENELQIPLFFKSGRGIRLTPAGVRLKNRASELVALEEDLRFEFQGREKGSINVFISSEEILQTSYGLRIAKKINELFPNAYIQFFIRSESVAIQQVFDGEVHLAITTQEPPQGMSSKVLEQVQFQTCASKKHPIIGKKGNTREVSIEEVLEYPFVAPDSAILGKINSKSDSIDGWRDDKFPRKVRYKVCGLKLLENIVHDGLALAYLPDHFIAASNLVPLKVMNCTYTCQQKIRIVAKEPSYLSWLDKLWRSIE